MKFEARKLFFPLKSLVLAMFFLAAIQPMEACSIARIDQPLPSNQGTSLDAVAEASNAFGFKLYQKLVGEKPDDNQFMSGFSVFAALAMTSEGAGGGSLEILQNTLGLPERRCFMQD